MDGVAAEVAEEIAMLFHHDGVDAGARQQESQHHPGGATADDAARRFHCVVHGALASDTSGRWPGDVSALR